MEGSGGADGGGASDASLKQTAQAQIKGLATFLSTGATGGR